MNSYRAEMADNPRNGDFSRNDPLLGSACFVTNDMKKVTFRDVERLASGEL
jgi:hypothetical protein